MKIKDIIKHLDGAYTIKEIKCNDETIIEVYPNNFNGSVNLDSGLKLKKDIDNKSFILYEKHREQEYEIDHFNKEVLSFLALYLVIKRKFEEAILEEDVKNELRALEDDLAKGEHILQKVIDPKFFSLKQPKLEAINIKEVNNKCNVFYLNSFGEEILISKGRVIGSALVVTYNFSLMLQKFDSLIWPWRNKLALSQREEENLKRLYINK